MTVACDALPQQKHRVAIVGSGISGAAVAHFLREGLGDAVELVVIEAGSSIGDRILSWNKNGTILEAGAAALHSSNKYLGSFLKDSNFAKIPVNPTFGLFDGARMLWDKKIGSRSFFINLLVRYRGPYLRLRREVYKVLKKMESIYDQQEGQEQAAYEVPGTLWQAVGLEHLATKNFEDYLMNSLDLNSSTAGRRLVHEFVYGVSMLNYNQPPSGLNALSGLIGLASVLTGSLYAIGGGNQRLPEILLNQSGISVARGNLLLSTRIGAVSSSHASSSNSQTLHTIRLVGMSNEDILQNKSFDAIFVTSPLASSALRINPDFQSVATVPSTFQRTVVTFVHGQFKPSIFPSKLPNSSIPDHIIFARNSVKTLEDRLPLTSLSKVDKDVYRLLSSRPVNRKHLDGIFQGNLREEQSHNEQGHTKHYEILSVYDLGASGGHGGGTGSLVVGNNPHSIGGNGIKYVGNPDSRGDSLEGRLFAGAHPHFSFLSKQTKNSNISRFNEAKSAYWKSINPVGGIFYLSGLEASTSTMEVCAISAKNAVNLYIKSLYQKNKKLANPPNSNYSSSANLSTSSTTTATSMTTDDTTKPSEAVFDDGNDSLKYPQEYLPEMLSSEVNYFSNATEVLAKASEGCWFGALPSHCTMSIEACREFYDNWAGSYNAAISAISGGYAIPTILLENAVGTLQRLQGFSVAQAKIARSLRRSLSVLDAGCGTGVAGVTLRQMGFVHITGVDISGNMVDIARKTGAYDSVVLGDVRPKELRMEASTINAYADQVREPGQLFPNDSFDVLLGVELLQHLNPFQKPTQLDEFARIVKPVSNSRFCIRKKRYYGFFKGINCSQKQKQNTHTHSYTLDMLQGGLVAFTLRCDLLDVWIPAMLALESAGIWTRTIIDPSTSSKPQETVSPPREDRHPYFIGLDLIAQKKEAYSRGSFEYFIFCFQIQRSFDFLHSI